MSQIQIKNLKIRHFFILQINWDYNRLITNHDKLIAQKMYHMTALNFRSLKFYDLCPKYFKSESEHLIYPMVKLHLQRIISRMSQLFCQTDQQIFC